MRLILARHGNTFGPDDKVVWVGARTDLPLVPKGLEQATRIADALLRTGQSPTSIYAGPLRRTQETARVIAGVLDVKIQTVAPELREIDYGVWEARTSDEISAKYGEHDILLWQAASVWPEGYGWSPTEVDILAGWQELLLNIERENQPGAIVLIVSSNGIYKVIAKAIGLDAAETKMATGNLAVIEVSDGAIKALRWNIPPEAL